MNQVRRKWQPHTSHLMSAEESVAAAPAGTPRFYGAQRCYRCNGEVLRHPAGCWADPELDTVCTFKEDNHEW